jgi:hypothetical protein
MRRNRLRLVAVYAALFTVGVGAAVSAPGTPHCPAKKACGTTSVMTSTSATTTTAPTTTTVPTTTTTALPTAPGPAGGVQFHCLWGFYSDADREAVLDKIAAAQLTWVRIDAAWNGIEATAKGDRNQWYIGRLDFCVNQALQRGLKVLVTLWLTPAWANGGNQYAPPADAQDYGDFARWAASYWRGRVSAWEVWNEPDPAQSFWQGTVSQYVALLKAGYAGFHAGDPAAQVVLGGPSSNDDGWIGQVYALGGGSSFDVVATHPYQAVADDPPEFPDDGHRWWFTHFPSVLAVMRLYGDGDKPVWFTEFGWSAHSDWSGIANWQLGVTETQQADYAVRAFEYATANYPNVKVMFWYKERSNPAGSNVHEEGYALLRGDLSPRPVYGALQSYFGG